LEAVYSSEALVKFYLAVRGHIPEQSYFHSHSRENLKFNTFCLAENNAKYVNRCVDKIPELSFNVKVGGSFREQFALKV
jgi:hypothetical protein